MTPSVHGYVESNPAALGVHRLTCDAEPGGSNSDARTTNTCAALAPEPQSPSSHDRMPALNNFPTLREFCTAVL